MTEPNGTDTPQKGTGGARSKEEMAAAFRSAFQNFALVEMNLKAFLPVGDPLLRREEASPKPSPPAREVEMAKENMNVSSIRDRLVEHGQALFNAPGQFVEFTHVAEADALLNDLTAHPHAFVLACVMDRQIKAERAWLIPYRISEKLGVFSMERLLLLSSSDVHRLMTQPEPLHRFVDTMSGLFHSAVRRISEHYAGDAALIWTGKPSSAEVVYRFLEFDGVGPKIATMAANILARDFKVPFTDYFSIDISADAHIRRVFSRLGLCTADPSVEQVVYRARALHPAFPGMMDLPCWEIGRSWCKPHGPECDECYMRDICPTAIAKI